MRGAVKTELRELIRLSLPLAAAQAGTQLMGLVDVAVLGRYGALELAASGLGNAVFFGFSMMGMGMMFGVDPMISQAIGAGDHTRARQILWQGIWLAFAVTVVLMAILFTAAYLLPWFGVEREFIAPARTYLVIRTIGAAPYLLFIVVRGYLQALGITRPLLIAMIAANVVNLAGDILLVFGGGILPEWAGPLRAIPAMGVAGAAISTLTCALLQLAIVAFAVRATEVPGHVDHRWSTREIGQAFRVGLPVALQLGAEIGIFALVAVLAARLGTLHLAAHQLAIALAAFTYTVSLGIAAAGSVRVGIAIGARDPIATRFAGHLTFLVGGGTMAFMGAVFALWPRAIARIVTDQADVIAAATPLMLVAAVFQLSDGIQATGSGVLRGAGDTKFAFWANVAGHWFIGFPIALYLGFQRGMGIVGLWWGLCAGLTAVAVMLFVRFERLSRTAIEPI